MSKPQKNALTLPTLHLTPIQKVENWLRDVFLSQDGVVPDTEIQRLIKMNAGVYGRPLLIRGIKDLQAGGYIERQEADWVWPMMKTASLRTALKKLEGIQELANGDGMLARFEEGVSADPTENMSPEQAAEWKKQNEAHKDEFTKSADIDPIDRSEAMAPDIAAEKMPTLSEALSDLGQLAVLDPAAAKVIPEGKPKVADSLYEGTWLRNRKPSQGGGESYFYGQGVSGGKWRGLQVDFNPNTGGMLTAKLVDLKPSTMWDWKPTPKVPGAVQNAARSKGIRASLNASIDDLGIMADGCPDNLDGSECDEWEANTDKYEDKFKAAEEGLGLLAEGCPDNLDESECKEWEANTEKYKDKFDKSAAKSQDFAQGWVDAFTGAKRPSKNTPQYKQGWKAGSIATKGGPSGALLMKYRKMLPKDQHQAGLDQTVASMEMLAKEDYPWEQCIKDKSADPKVRNPEALCGWIKAKSEGKIADAETELERLAKFREGESVDVPEYLKEHGNPEAAKEWEAMNEEYGDKLKTAKRLSKVWVVMDGGPDAEMADVMYETTVEGLGDYIRGTSDWKRLNPMMFDNPREAKTEAGKRLKTKKTAGFPRAPTLPKALDEDLQHAITTNKGKSAFMVARATLKPWRVDFNNWRKKVHDAFEKRLKELLPDESAVPGLSDFLKHEVWGGPWMFDFSITGGKALQEDARKLRSEIPPDVPKQDMGTLATYLDGLAKIILRAEAKHDKEVSSRKTRIEKLADKMGVKMSKSASDAIGRTILQQMGGAGRLKAMLGMNYVRFLPSGVEFSWPNKTRTKGNLVRVILEPSDTYKMEFFNATRGSRKLVKSLRDVYAEDLVHLFEHQTGWFLRLAAKKMAGEYVNLWAAVSGGDKLIDVTDEAAGKNPSYWARAVSGRPFVIVPLKHVPLEMAQMLSDQGTKVQAFPNGFVAWKAARKYAPKGLKLAGMEKIQEPSEEDSADIKKTAGKPAGLYGFTKRVQTDCESSVRKLQKTALKIARAAYNKDAEVAPFLSTHTKRANSLPAKMLTAAMKELGPKIASETDGPRTAEWKGWSEEMPVQVVSAKGSEVFQNLVMARKRYPDLDPKKNGKQFTWAMKGEVAGKPATRFETHEAYKMLSMSASDDGGGLNKEATHKSDWGLYGFRAKTAGLGLQACRDLREASGHIASGLHGRKADSHEHITSFLKSHAKEAACMYSRMLYASYPDADRRCASAAPSSVSGWLAWED